MNTSLRLKLAQVMEHPQVQFPYRDNWLITAYVLPRQLGEPDTIYLAVLQGSLPPDVKKELNEEVGYSSWGYVMIAVPKEVFEAKVIKGGCSE